MGILTTGVSIVVMCSAGIAVSTVFKWLHNYEFNVGKPSNGSRSSNDRISSLNDRVKPGNR
ncbi:hypothetical protein Blue_082 [Bacillus phage Deep Blue]|uniref:Uncharacterized protein n=1 Tax=Bacillus phage Deep Blue TaxID=1792245 RepID=A0A140HLP3_9CAUD|nr:hypothetical protein Blue_082 [Bacillus phage Deep Blue]AMO25905.1 hypothetical protein Blue_082 [Bacillus phage Deep Blue]